MKSLPKGIELILRILALFATGLSQSNISVALRKLGYKACKTTVGNKLRAVFSGSLFKPKAVKKSTNKIDSRDLRHIRRCVRFFGDRSYMDLFNTFLKEGKNVSYSTVRRATKKI